MTSPLPPAAGSASPEPGGREGRGWRGAPGVEWGLTLIELLITITILGVVGTVLLGAWQATIAASNTNRAQASVRTVLTSAADLVTSPATPRIACTPNGATATNEAAIITAYQTAARNAQLPPKGGWTPEAIRVTDVEFWNGGDTGDVFTNTCYETAGVAGLVLQQVTITVTSPNGKSSATLQVVKGDR